MPQNPSLQVKATEDGKVGVLSGQFAWQPGAWFGDEKNKITNTV